MAEYVRVTSAPTQQQVDNFASLIGLGALGFTVYWLWQKVNAWEPLAAPYNYISAFYYYVVVVPLKGFAFVWDWFQYSGLTPYPNLNLCFSVLGVVLYAYLLFKLFKFLVIVFVRLEGIGLKGKWLIGGLALPAVFAAFWFICSLLFSWLFSY